MAAIQVKVRHFAVLRERRGCAEESLAVEVGTTAGALYRALFPPLPAGVMPVMYAVNRCYVASETLLADGDEVAFIPPLGGG